MEVVHNQRSLGRTPSCICGICWIETKGLTLEDIDRLMDGKKLLGGRGSEEGTDVIEGYDIKETASETITKVKEDE